MTKNELQKDAEKYLAQGHECIYATSDGNFFYPANKHDAKSHASAKKLELFVFGLPKGVTTATAMNAQAQYERLSGAPAPNGWSIKKLMDGIRKLRGGGEPDKEDNTPSTEDKAKQDILNAAIKEYHKLTGKDVAQGATVEDVNKLIEDHKTAAAEDFEEKKVAITQLLELVKGTENESDHNQAGLEKMTTEQVKELIEIEAEDKDDGEAKDDKTGKTDKK